MLHLLNDPGYDLNSTCLIYWQDNTLTRVITIAFSVYKFKINTVQPPSIKETQPTRYLSNEATASCPSYIAVHMSQTTTEL